MLHKQDAQGSVGAAGSCAGLKPKVGLLGCLFTDCPKQTLMDFLPFSLQGSFGRAGRSGISDILRVVKQYKPLLIKYLKLLERLCVGSSSGCK